MRHRSRSFNPRPLIKNSVILLIFLIVSAILYSNLSKLNEINLLFLRLGSTLLLVASYFIIRQIYRIYKTVKYWGSIQKDNVKLGIISIIVILLLIAFINREGILGPVVDTYHSEAQNFYPFTFSMENATETISNALSGEPIKYSEIETAIFTYTNEERIKAGLPQLLLDPEISEISRMHSADMVRNNYFDHVNLEGEDPTDRAIRMGFNKQKNLGGGVSSYGLAENIGKMPTGDVEGIGYVSNSADSIAKAQVESWMNSKGHRENILNPQYTHIGVGTSYDGTYYVSTQNFW